MTAQIIQFPIVKRPAPVAEAVAMPDLVNAFCDGYMAAAAVAAAPVAAPAMKRFEVGKTYSCRSIGDSDCIFSFTIVRRTAKRITFTTQGREVTRGVYECDGAEACKPHGTYSMCAVIRADKSCY